MAQPLSDILVLDFSTLLPGPLATLMLAEAGAEVVKLERPGTGKDARHSAPKIDGVSIGYAILNRGKKSIALDLKAEGAVESLRPLIEKADVLVEQFRPGVMDRLGVGYEDLKAINPGLIYCSITGYGQDGPYRDRAGHDLNYLSIAGMTAYNGRKASGPAPMAFQVADIAGGSCHAVMGVLAAVIHRQSTGEGQHVDISMTDAAFSLHGLAAPPALVGGQDPDLETTQLNGGGFYDCYRTRDGRFMSVAGLEPQFFTQFCQAIGKPELTSKGMTLDPTLVAEVKAEIAEVIGGQDYDHWCRVFADLDCCVEPVLSFSEATEHPQLKARDMVVEVPRHDGGKQRQVASPFKFSATPVGYRFSGARLGQHSDEVLADHGFSDEDIQAFKDSGAVG